MFARPHTHAHMQRYTHACTHAHMHIHAHTHTHAHTHRHTHTHTHAHTHTFLYPPWPCTYLWKSNRSTNLPDTIGWRRTGVLTNSGDAHTHAMIPGEHIGGAQSQRTIQSMEKANLNIN